MTHFEKVWQLLGLHARTCQLSVLLLLLKAGLLISTRLVICYANL